MGLLIDGWLTIGAGAVAGCRKLLSFALTTRSARTEADLDRAAQDLAEAVTVLGVDVALGLLFRGRPRDTFRRSYKGPLPPMREAMKVMPRAGPMHRYEFQVFYTRALPPIRGLTNRRNVAQIGRDWARLGAIGRDWARLGAIGRDWAPGLGSLAESVRAVRKTAYHESVHLWLNRTFSTFGRPALYMRVGAYKRPYILR